VRRSKIRGAIGVLVLIGVAPFAVGGRSPASAAASSHHVALNCAESTLCAEVANYADVFGPNYYVGHDEPSTLFYSNRPGAGNQMRYNLTLPTDPTPTNPTAPGKSYQFELSPTFWFGLALCDTQSYPEQVSTCTPNSDSNIVDPTVSPNHPGTAFLELQFYSPGWVAWPTWAVAAGATTCDPTKWCVAMNIDSLSQDPVNGTSQNSTCAGMVGTEYVNFAFVTKNGVSQAPANPRDSTLTTYTPDPAKDLFMSSGDKIQVTIHDTPNGLQTLLADKTTHQTGSMTASPANGFAQIQYDPTGSSCTAIPYAFHPMYSTSSEQTRVPWAAHTYNVAFSDEIGHFQNCEGPTPIPATPFGVDSNGAPIKCPAGNTEEAGANSEPTDGDDNFCFPGSEALTVHINGCTDTNTGFDGVAYEPVWPDGNTALHPTPVRFTSPLTGVNYNKQYQRVGFEADLPRIEANTCSRVTGAGCALIPTTDDGSPANFYPWFSTTDIQGSQCVWQLGGQIPGSTNDFGQNAGYGTLLGSTYLVLGGGGTSNVRYNNFRQILADNPCAAH
jgi:hypothetical protein